MPDYAHRIILLSKKGRKRSKKVTMPPVDASGSTPTALPADACLLLVDVQQGFDEPGWGQRNNPDLEETIAALLSAWRLHQRPIIHVQHMSQEPHSPLRPGLPGNAIKPEAAPLPGERLIQKTVNSAFIGTPLEKWLRKDGIRTLVVVGLTTDHCVSTTVRMAGNLGFQTYVVADAVATFDRTAYDGTPLTAQQIHTVALASLHGEFATVVTSRQVLGEDHTAVT